MRRASNMKDQAKAALEFIEGHKQHVLQTAKLIAPADVASLTSLTADFSADFAALSQLFDLTLNETASEQAHQLVSKLMLRSWHIGLSATLSPEADKWREKIKGYKLRERKAATKAENAAEIALLKAVEAEWKSDSAVSAGKEAVAILSAVNQNLKRAGFAAVTKEVVKLRIRDLRSVRAQL